MERLIMYADRAVRERVGNLYHQQVISLVQDQLEYDLDSEFIDIVNVEFSTDGSTYDWYLRPATLGDLDKISLSWRSDRGTRPERYVLLSAPGTPNSKILTYRAMSAVTAQTIRITGQGIGATTTPVADDVQARCHVPYVMAILMAHKDARRAAGHFGEYLAGIDEVRGRYISKYPTSKAGTVVGW